MSCCAAISSVPPMFRAAFASGTHSCAERSTTPRRAAGVIGAHQRSAEALTVRGAAAAARAHHVERSATQGDVPPSRSSARPARRGRAAHAGRRGALVRERLTAARRLRAGRGTRRAADGARRSTEAATGHFAEARAALLEGMELLPDGFRRAGGSDGGVRRTRAAARSPRGGARASPKARSSARRPRFGAGRGADGHLALDAFFRQDTAETRAWASGRSTSHRRWATAR